MRWIMSSGVTWTASCCRIHVYYPETLPPVTEFTRMCGGSSRIPSPTIPRLVKCRWLMRWLLMILTAATLTATETPSANKDWPVVSGPGGTHYSSLTQINRKNVRRLRRVWQFDSHDQFEGSELECNPVVVNG